MTTSLTHLSTFTGCGSQSAYSKADCSAIQIHGDGGALAYLSPLVHVADLPGWRAVCSVGSNYLVLYRQSNCLLSVVDLLGRRPEHNFGIACLMTSFQLIRCRPSNITSNTVCCSSPIPMLFCDCSVVQLCYCDTFSGPSSVLATQATLKATDWWLIDWLISLVFLLVA